MNGIKALILLTVLFVLILYILSIPVKKDLFSRLVLPIMDFLPASVSLCPL